MGDVGGSPYATWRKGLEGVTSEQLADGLRRCIAGGEAWPPSLPEFRAMCFPTDAELGIPRVRLAYGDAVAKRWHHPVIYETVRRLGGVYRFERLTDREALREFEAEYRGVVADFRSGKGFVMPEVAGHLEQSEKPRQQMTREQIGEQLAKLRQSMGLNKVEVRA